MAVDPRPKIKGAGPSLCATPPPSLQGWLGDAPLRLLLLPAVHMEALDVLGALGGAWVGGAGVGLGGNREWGEILGGQ